MQKVMQKVKTGKMKKGGGWGGGGGGGGQEPSDLVRI